MRLCASGESHTGGAHHKTLLGILGCFGDLCRCNALLLRERKEGVSERWQVVWTHIRVLVATTDVAKQSTTRIHESVSAHLLGLIALLDLFLQLRRLEEHSNAERFDDATLREGRVGARGVGKVGPGVRDGDMT